MVEENQETKLPQEQTGEPTIFPPRSLEHMSGSNTNPKTTWPELEGLTAEEAEKKIKEDMPRVRTQVVPQDSFVTMDFNQQRVRIFVDSSGKVARTPRIG